MLYHSYLSVLPLAFPEPPLRAQLRGKQALKGRVRREQILRIEESNVEFFERNKIGKISRKIEVIDLIEIKVVTSEK